MLGQSKEREGPQKWDCPSKSRTALIFAHAQRRKPQLWPAAVLLVSCASPSYFFVGGARLACETIVLRCMPE